MVNYVECEQGSPRWLAARLGMPTASKFGCIVSHKGKAVTGAKRHTYMAELLGERLTGMSTDCFVSAAMERGTELEPDAREWYATATGNTVCEVGFGYRPDIGCGASPDGLIGDLGGLEIKVPLLTNQIKHLMANTVPDQWIVQVHGCIWLCERSWWDFVCYHENDDVPNLLVRTHRNEKMCKAFGEHIRAFCVELDELEARIRKEHLLPERATIDLDKLSGVCENAATILEGMEEMEASEL